MGRRFAFFVGELFMDYQTRLYEGISEAAEEYGVQIDLFSNYGVFAFNYLHTRGELNVINIPDLNKYDGILIAPDTLTVEGMYEELSEKLKSCTMDRIVSIRMKEEKFYNVLVDDKSSIEDIVEHFITVHGLKKIFYMSGRQDLIDSKYRLDGYLEVMKKHGLPVRDTMIFHGTYWTDKAKECLEAFAQDPDKPEAIVCANDYMAISLIREFNERGISIPDDIKLSGYDNLVEGQLFEQRLATADVPAEKMGRRALEVLIDLSEGKTVDKNSYIASTPIMQGTCGCKCSYNNNISEKLYKNFLFLKDSVRAELQLSGEFESCETIDDVLRSAYKYSLNFVFDEIYVCMCEYDSDEDNVNLGNYTTQMRLVAVFGKSSGYTRCDEVFERVDIVPPKYRDKNPIFNVFPLHYRGHCMGYLAITMKDCERMKEGFTLWSNALSNYLDKIRMYEKNKTLLRYREESYQDSLTGLMNRRGFELFLQKAVNKSGEDGLYIVSVDMDGLKYINDNFGHQEGDRAIKDFSYYLKVAQNENVGCARTGGDEFLMVILGGENNVKSICEYIRRKVKHWNIFSGKKYEMSASLGYAKYNEKEGIVTCINKADEKMYAEKATKKNARG
ncbi:MAG: GGDEF domain-containing protein [Lachnospiraceae bacterium]|nr:GGDEF domain-containing protein [Lachnospiraceae bacterium]